MSTVNEIFENQFIIRFPLQIAQKIDEQLKKKKKEIGSVSDKLDDSQIDLQIQPQFKNIDSQNNLHQMQFNIKMDENYYVGDLVDLPCIIESQKTSDKINFFKSNDISQMILVHENDQQREEFKKNQEFKQVKEEIQEYKNKYDEKEPQKIQLQKFQSLSGISPITKLIAKKFFRSKPQIPREKILEIEQKMVQIIDKLSKTSNKDQDNNEIVKEKKKTGPKGKKKQNQEQ